MYVLLFALVSLSLKRIIPVFKFEQIEPFMNIRSPETNRIGVSKVRDQQR